MLRTYALFVLHLVEQYLMPQHVVHDSLVSFLILLSHKAQLCCSLRVLSFAKICEGGGSRLVVGRDWRSNRRRVCVQCCGCISQCTILLESGMEDSRVISLAGDRAVLDTIAGDADLRAGIELVIADRAGVLHCQCA